MDYNFFLFIKLNDLLFPSKVEYDLQFRYMEVKFKEWQEWDFINGHEMGAYESIIKFLKK